MKKLYSLLAGVLLSAGATVSAQDFYMIGSNVNGYNWSLGEPSCKFKYLGDGIFEWTGNTLGNGFKINDGDWINTEYNFGSNGDAIVLGQPYYYNTGSDTHNLSLGNISELINPKVTINSVEGYITVTGEPNGSTEWFITGTFCNNQLTYALSKISDEIYEYKGLELTASETGVNTFVIAATGWSMEFGTPLDNDGITSSNLSVTIGEYGTCPYSIFGTYDVIWNINTKTVTFKPVLPDTQTGTLENPLSVAQFLAQGIPSTAVSDTYVQGYIVGYVNGAQYSGGVRFDLSEITESNNTNLLLAGSINERDYSACIPVQLPAGEIRSALNLAQNPDNLNKEIILCGSHEKYFGVNGLKTVSSYKWINYDPVKPDPETTVYYIIGKDVNGHNWELAAEDCKFEYKGDGIYEWSGEKLSDEFKINDGSWDNDKYNIGSDGKRLVFGEPYRYLIGGNTANIEFEGFTAVVNPKVTLNTMDRTIIVEGEKKTEGPIIDENYARFTVKTKNGPSSISIVPKDTKTYVSIDLDEYWKISSVSVNGTEMTAENLTEEPFNVNEDLTVEVEVAYAAEIEWLDENSGIANFDNSDLTIRVDSGKIIIENLTGGEEVALYSLAGQIIDRQISKSDSITIIPMPGIYVVRVNNNAVKVYI